MLLHQPPQTVAADRDRGPARIWSPKLWHPRSPPLLALALGTPTAPPVSTGVIRSAVLGVLFFAHCVALVEPPFQIDRGMDRLLEAYRSGGGAPVAARDVHFYEVCLAAGWVCDALESNDEAMIAHAALPLQSLLRRIGA